jgi:hypothetical protein
VLLRRLDPGSPSAIPDAMPKDETRLLGTILNARWHAET